MKSCYFSKPQKYGKIREKNSCENGTWKVKKAVWKIEVVLSDERLITPSGLCMVGQAMAKSDLIKKAARMRTDKRSQPQIKNGDILSVNISLFKACYVQPTALENGLVPLDIDVTPFDNSKSHKEGVSRTYKNFDGYAPIMAYIGTEGYGCNFELREGSQHCQNGTPVFLRETIAAAKQMTN